MTAATTTRKQTFNAFLRSEQGRQWCPPAIYCRLRTADIKSLAALERWTRERYPEQYKNYNLFADCTGREMMRKLWAEYLE